jgi:hypothetical protein
LCSLLQPHFHFVLMPRHLGSSFHLSAHPPNYTHISWLYA